LPNFDNKLIKPKIKKLLNGKNSKGAQTFYQNGKKLQTLHEQMKIIDEFYYCL
jgi:hypothetical protein